ncbi:MAG: argininosuccinate lyase [Clostridia bacterium]|nr:argininosuccinate lyase [Clostridia bacterium]
MAGSEKMWAGRTGGNTEKISDEFNSSIGFDSRMYREDIRGSIAHARMLLKQGIISEFDCEAIVKGLEGILADLESGELKIDMSCEDIHMFVEQVLTERIGNSGKKLHTARSRNDQVALDLRLYLMGQIKETVSLTNDLVRAICDLAEKNADTIMPGYTHLQRAQPVSFGHHLMAYASMLLRDIKRLWDCYLRTNVSPIGACALAGTTYNTDRGYEASLLGIGDITSNSMDSVSDRDFVIELAADLSIIMMHLSRLSEEFVLWSSWEFKFIELSDGYTTGSSIMPQKKNPDMAELVRGKTGRVYGDLMTLLTVMKGLPLAYNKDMQEDKEAIFDAVDTVKNYIRIYTGMISTMKVNEEAMKKAAQNGFINATDLADYLVGKGMPFRSAYKASGLIVALCIDKNYTLETLPLELYRSVSEDIDEDVYDAVNIDNCLARRKSYGGPEKKSVFRQIKEVRGELDD